MDAPESKNYFKLAFILLEIIPKHLRSIFKTEWDKRNPTAPWNDDEASRQAFINNEKQGPNWKNNKRNVPSTGDRDQWDLTRLSFMILYSHSLNLHPQLSLYKQAHKIKEIRNKYFAHSSTTSLSDSEFEAVYSEMEKCMDVLNCATDLKTQMKEVRNGVVKLTENDIQTLNKRLHRVAQLEAQNQQLLIDVLRQSCSLQINCKTLSTFVFIVFLGYLMFTILLMYTGLGIHVFQLLKNTSVFRTNFHEPTQLMSSIMPNNFVTYFPKSRKPVHYVGHSQEIDTASCLLANGSYQMVSIVGAPAIGKTATAIAVGQTLQEKYNFQVAFVNFKDFNVTLHSQDSMFVFNEIIASLGGEPMNEVTIQKFKTQVRKLTFHQTLLIFDNVDNILKSTAKSAFFETAQICVDINSIKILSTSRKHFNMSSIPIFELILEHLTEPESHDLLNSLYPGLRENSVLQIAQKTGGVPLLIEIIGSLLHEGVYEEDELLSELEKANVLVIVNSPENAYDLRNYYTLVKALFNGLDPNLQDMFIALGAIPTSFNQQTANVVTKLSLQNKVDLYPLVQLNLLKRFKSATRERRYELHSIIREFSMLVAKEDPWWSLRQCTSSIIFEDYHEFHSMTLERFWLKVDSATSNPLYRIEDVNAVSQQFTNSLNSFHFLGEDELLAVMYHFIGDLYWQVNLNDKAVVPIQKSFDIYSNLYGSHYANTVLFSAEHCNVKWSHSWYQGFTSFLIPLQSPFFSKPQNDINFYNDHRNIRSLVVELTEQALTNNSEALSTLKNTLNISHSSWYYLLNQTTSERGFAFSNFEASTAEIFNIFGMLLYEHAFYNESIAIFSKALNLVHPDLFKSSQIMIHIGYAQYKTQCVQVASKSLYQAVEMFVKSGALKSLMTRQTIIEDDRTTSAEDTFDFMLTSNAAIFAATLLESQHQYENSFQMLEIAYQIDSKLLGNHIKTRVTLATIARLYSKLGDTRQALQYKRDYVVKDSNIKGVFNLHIPEQDSEWSIRHLEGRLCETNSTINTTISWVDKQDRIEFTTFSEPTQMMYRLQYAILDQTKVWNNVFDLFSSSNYFNMTVSNLPEELFNITLLHAKETIPVNDFSQIQTNIFSCPLDDSKMKNFVFERSTFSKKVLLTNKENFYVRSRNVLKHISKIQSSHGDSISTSIMKFLLAHLHASHNDWQMSRKLFREAFEIIAQPGMLKMTKKTRFPRRPVTGPQTAMEFLTSCILLQGAHPEIQNVSTKALNKALRYHKAINNKLEVSQILMALANAKKEQQQYEAQQLFAVAILYRNFWKLSSYYKRFLTPNDQRQHEARQVYEYGHLAFQLGFFDKGFELFKIAKEISKTAIYRNNCEPLFFEYLFFWVSTVGQKYPDWPSENYDHFDQIVAEIVNLQNAEKLCGFENAYQLDLLFTTHNKLTRLDDFREMISILNFDQDIAIPPNSV